jgi:small redox-active disulfide protein 2
MHLVQVYGAGCPRCRATADVIEKTARKLGVEIYLEKVTDLGKISDRGILQTPGVAVDRIIVSQGKIPTEEDVKGWLGGD